MAFSRQTSRYNFKHRSYYLQTIEKDYGEFILSCRHRDMLRCSVSKHFRSCYAPDGACFEIPSYLCTKPTYAIIGKKDKSGDFIWRAFIRYGLRNDSPRIWHELTIFKIYGNPPERVEDIIWNKLSTDRCAVYFSKLDASGWDN